MRKTLPLLVCSWLAIVTPALADGPPAVATAKVATSYDMAYMKAGDKELKLDLACPAEGDGPFPAVVVIHGGGWRGGSYQGNRALLSEFAKRGYVAISPQYEFCPAKTFPAQVYEVKAAVRWLRTNAAKYKVDPDHIGATGFSAGGHLALMLGVAGPDAGLEGDVSKDAPSSRVQAVVNYFGPSDLAADDIPEVSKPMVRDFLGSSAKEKPELWDKASPLKLVTKDDPPILTFQGTKDPLVPETQATKLGAAMTKAGVKGRTELLIGAGHGWQGPELERTLRETYAFFDLYLKPAKAAK